jgi:SAM-dependent methyltransferase
METSLLEALRADPGLQRRAAAALREDGDRAALTLRREVDDPALAAAALTLAELRDRARVKFGERAERMYFTRAGLEQATRWPVARRRAARFARHADAVTDLCCGIGTDALAFAAAGLQVRAVDADVATAAIARANAEALGVSLDVTVGDALEVGLGRAVFADPARRRGPEAQPARRRGPEAQPARRGGAGRAFNPADYSPPLDALLERIAGADVAAVKLGPGIKHSWLDGRGGEAEWVSVDRDVVEACLWLGEPVEAERRASVCVGGEWHELAGSGTDRAETGPVARYLFEPDGAVIRAGLVAELAARLGAHTGHPDIAYLYADRLVSTPFARAWEVVDVWPLHPKKLRTLLAERGVGKLVIKQRGTGIVPDEFRRRLRLKGDEEATLVATRLGDRHVALFCKGV